MGLSKWVCLGIGTSGCVSSWNSPVLLNDKPDNYRQVSCPGQGWVSSKDSGTSKSLTEGSGGMSYPCLDVTRDQSDVLWPLGSGGGALPVPSRKPCSQAPPASSATHVVVAILQKESPSGPSTFGLDCVCKKNERRESGVQDHRYRVSEVIVCSEQVQHGVVWSKCSVTEDPSLTRSLSKNRRVEGGWL